MKNTLEIRYIFINYFKNKEYTILDSSPLIPVNDNSILFTNAGMNQFKDFFMGKRESSVDKIATIQRCLRAGGKHNDLEEVGYTNRHHTFFEMLGNFSFGKVTKEEIITDIWKILTEKFYLSPDRIFITVNKNDIETYNIWRNLIGLKNGRISLCSNFWQMSEIGPCGPSTEIFYYLNKGSIPNNFYTNENYLEIWNIVFMQYYRNKEYILTKLPNLGIDTGVGLERIASILQGVSSNYKIDIFKDLINNIRHLTGGDNRSSLNVIADHIRAIIFLINEGLLPSNEGRGYVLRRIIRRAIRHGRYLGVKKKFLYQLIEPCLEVLNLYYPKYIFFKQLIKEVVKEEEEKFSITLDRGMQKLLQIIKRLPNNKMEGKIASNLYETYGFPLYITQEICKENNILINDGDISENILMNKTDFLGWELNNDLFLAQIVSIIVDNKVISYLTESKETIILLNKTNFFPEYAGQIGDKGYIYSKDNVFEILYTKKYNDLVLHIGRLIKGVFRLNDIVKLEPNIKHRKEISINHTSIHLLNLACKKFLKNFTHKGSYINDQYLRFDLQFTGKLYRKLIEDIELWVNKQIRYNLEIKTTYVLKRIVNIQKLCQEICSGPHVKYTGEIGYFNILSWHSISNSVFRIIGAKGRDFIKKW